MLQLLTYMVIFIEINVFLHLSRIGLLGENRAYLHLETPKFRKYSFHNIYQFTQGNNMLDVPASKTMVFFRETHILPQLS
jgi:hypothetical protein